MKCGKDELRVHYSERWNYHIWMVSTVVEGVGDEYHWSYLKHAQHKTICGNVVEFHRYYSGINVRVVTMTNWKVEGLFNDSRCLDNH